MDHNKRCSKCGSLKMIKTTTNELNYSFTKGTIGGIIAGSQWGTLAGIETKEKVSYQCAECGNSTIMPYEISMDIDNCLKKPKECHKELCYFKTEYKNIEWDSPDYKPTYSLGTGTQTCSMDSRKGAIHAPTLLTSVKIPEGTENIMYNAFKFSPNLSSVTIPSSVKEIGAGAFEKTALSSVELPTGVTKIESMAFWGCKQLKTVHLPKTLKFIGGSAFAYCSNIETIYFDGTKKEWENVKKDKGWDDSSNNYKVICTDGEVTREPKLSFGQRRALLIATLAVLFFILIFIYMLS